MKQTLFAPSRRKASTLLSLLIVVMLFSVSSYAQEKQKTLLVWGDSLSAAYGIPIEKGWVSLLSNSYKTLNIVNASISGETTQGGKTRLAHAVTQYKPDIIILELGANDGLRGLPITTIKANLKSMIETAQKAGANVILAGMQIPPNYGFQYTKSFEKTYKDLAKDYKTGLIPFFLDGIATKFELIQNDGLHPTAEAQPIILELVKPHLDRVLNNSVTPTLSQ